MALLVTVLAVGHKPEPWVTAAWETYANRLGKDLRVELRQVTPAAGSMDVVRARRLEGERLSARLPDRARLVVLDERGSDCDSKGFAKRLQLAMQAAQPLAFAIGGATGIDPALRQRADEIMRLSAMTLPHMLARVVLIEQIYRAWSLIHGQPYHRA